MSSGASPSQPRKRRRGSRPPKPDASAVRTPNTGASAPAPSPAAPVSKSKRKRGAAIPKPGDSDYLSPTQLRNRRKRKAAKLLKAKGDESDSKNGKIKKNKSKNKTKNKNKNKDDAPNPTDPSLLYSSSPLTCPAVLSFKSLFPSAPVHLGSPLGWRVISKLPWLPSSRRFGMYLPSSHAGGASTSPNNHPALNQLVSKVNDACGRSKVEGYDEETGKGCLRYAQFSVDRPTSTVAV
eukprot:CAMPEP_0182457700 /NCGR_PEP_ID=MMETSP1319-20130603/3218_1 /TAXON_ID=172717 /ORGANISM="Bolidomonas pacifica, Strain RCC208" /LENGTH=236 /DNA_ID=CAMNT_0024656223 /DNA_START=31 /DNA_END=737 /DNA_ORIENTATION=-